jgi:nucleotide-binding universal stress UspA family protein
LDEEPEMSTFPSKILLATDGSEDSALAARAAVDLCNKTGAELHVVHVDEARQIYPPATSGPPPPTPTKEELRKASQKVLDQQIKEIKEAGGNIEEAHLRAGRPEEEILRLSEDIVAGLIVVGNQGLGGKFSRMRRFLMGSVSETVTRYARCSVMVVRKDLYDRPST